MSRFVFFLEELDATRVAAVGGKAAHLGQLIRWGFTVPAGFCVAAAAMDALMDGEGLRERVTRLASRIRPLPLEDSERFAARIRELIERAPVPAAVEEEIRGAWARLAMSAGTAPLVAVRSSLVTRDGGRSSLPGQLDTYLDVAGIESVLQGVRRCWASAWSARATVTRMRLGLGPQDLIVAPLVQLMVRPQVAGVLFTADPLSGDAKHALVEAAAGLGEAVVSGRITPDRYLVHKESLRTIGSSAGDRPFRVVLDEEEVSRTRRAELGTSAPPGGSLSPGQLEELVRAAIRIEGSYGGQPQDVEWAFADGTLHILQTRRVAAPAARSPAGAPASGRGDEGDDGLFHTSNPDPSCTYTSANVSEVLPGVLTPLTTSGLKPLDHAFWRTFHELGLERDPFPPGDRDLLYLALFHGRPHLNLSRFRRVASQVPGASVAEFERSVPGRGDVQGGDDLGGEDAAPFRLTPSSLWSLVRVFGRSVRMWRRAPRALERCAKAVEREYHAVRRTDLTELPLESLLGMVGHDRDDARRVMALHIRSSVIAVAFHECLRSLCARWLGDASGATATRLVTGLATLESARPNREIFGLYRYVRAEPSLRDAFLANPPDALPETLRRMETAAARGFSERLAAFLARYGYRSVNEMEFMLPSWDRDPGFVLSVIRNLLRTRDPEDPESVERRRGEERLRTLREARARLDPLRRRVFLEVLDQAQAFIARRERSKALLMMDIHAAKNAYFELGRRLQEAGTLRDASDLYFLTHREVVRVCRGESSDTGERIVARRRAWERYRQVRLPETFRGRPTPLDGPQQRLAEEDAAGDTVLAGLGVSPGRVTGKARVILDPRADATIEEGEILVAPVTDAGWTPLFLLAAALVVDVGGLLSHGSIVAREYGIPGVLNVLSGTTRIRTGQTLTVDGTRGTVRIHRSTA